MIELKSIPTRGRTLDHAAAVYDSVEPFLLLGRQAEYDLTILHHMNLKPSHRVLDLGCGTGILTAMVADRLSGYAGGEAVGIDAAARMIEVARKKRASAECRFEVMAAENLDFSDGSFDTVISSLFFHHVDANLKERALREAFRVLKPGGRMVIADMHSPTTFFGALVSHVSRWFFMQPEIGENIRGILPDLIERCGFEKVETVAVYFGYISVFSTVKPL